MSNSFIDAISDETTKTFTENGSLTYNTSLSANVDLFFMGSALRGKQPKFIVDLFIKAYIENKDMALANLWYLRDIRNGQGERQSARNILKYIGTNYNELITNDFLNKIVQYGRYDDILTLLSTNTDIVIGYINDELKKNNSLLAKWLPSINTSSNKTKSLGHLVRKKLGLSCVEYRKLLSKLRKEQKLVETALSTKQYSSIQYDKVPSQASLKYRLAFARNDGERYLKYIENVKNGKTKINTATLTPVDIVKNYTKNGYSIVNNRPENEDVLNTMWNNLINVFSDNFENSIVVADTSGSMFDTYNNTSVKPIDVSLSLALYIAERNKGLFHNKFMTFSANPTLQTIKGSSLYEKLMNLNMSDWDMNTDLDKVFKVILNACKLHNVPESDCPKRIYIISDMEFDGSVNYNKTTYDRIASYYNDAGYKMPEVIFWNASARQNNVPVRFNQQGVGLISGFSPNILKYILNENDISPEKIMLNVLRNYLDK